MKKILSITIVLCLVASICFGQTIKKAKIADIACGCGSFLFDIAKELKILTGKNYFEIFKDHLFGLDIQEYSVTRTKILLSLLALSAKEDHSEFIFNIKIISILSDDFR